MVGNEATRRKSRGRAAAVGDSRSCDRGHDLQCDRDTRKERRREVGCRRGTSCIHVRPPGLSTEPQGAASPVSYFPAAGDSLAKRAPRRRGRSIARRPRPTGFRSDLRKRHGVDGHLRSDPQREWEILRSVRARRTLVKVDRSQRGWAGHRGHGRCGAVRGLWRVRRMV